VIPEVKVRDPCLIHIDHTLAGKQYWQHYEGILLSKNCCSG
jgi:hypothetical protein